MDRHPIVQPRIALFKPLIEQEELDAARSALELGWLGMGSYVEAFEQQLEKLIDAPDRRVVALSTGHAALHLALLLADVGPGDEVITPAFNNAADFQAILATGAEPVLCDVDDASLCIDLDKAEQLVSSRTKAVIAMDYDCMLCDHDRVARFAEAHRLRVVHDAAHSLGSQYKGKMVGAFSDLTMFSFDPIKTITCIDGGALVVKEPADAHAIACDANVGNEPVDGGALQEFAFADLRHRNARLSLSYGQSACCPWSRPAREVGKNRREPPSGLPLLQ